MSFSVLAVALSNNIFGDALGKTVQQAAQAPRDAGAKADDEKETRLLEPGKPIKRELAGAGSHIYQIRLSAGQFLKVIIEQQGLDVVAQLSGPDGARIAEFDREVRNQGQELVSLVAEAEGAYRLTVQPRRKQSPAGYYEMRIEELRAATENDIALQEALKLLQGASKPTDAGKYEEALPLIERALEIRERVLGPEHRDVADALNSLARLYWYKGAYAKAMPLYQRALAIVEKVLEPEHPWVAVILNNLALVYSDTDDYEKAELLHQRALTIREKSLGPESPSVAVTLNNLAKLYHVRSDYAKAEQFYLRALTIWEKSLGHEHQYVGNTLNNLAALYKDRGEYAKAEPIYQRALAIMEKLLGPEHPSVANLLNNLATFHHEKGDYAKAEQFYLRSLAIREKLFGAEHPDIAQSFHNLATLYKDKGEYPKAEQMYQRSITIREKTVGPEHSLLVSSLSNLANLYKAKGDYAKAEQLHLRALKIREKSLGPETLEVAGSLNDLANIYREKGDYANAERFHERALKIREKTLGPDHPEVAQSLSNLAGVHFDRGDYAKAEPLYERALNIREKALGPFHTGVADTLGDLAILYRHRRDYLKSERLFQRALEIGEKATGPEHPDVGGLLNELAVLYAAKGDFAQALAIQARANSVSERNLALNLGDGSERQKLAYLGLFSKETAFTLSLHSQVAPHDPQARDLAFTTLLRRKGRGLEAMADTIGALRRRAAPEDQRLFDQLAEARSELAALMLKESGTDKPETYQARLKSIVDKVEELESALSARRPEFRAQSQPVTLAAVQAALPAEGFLIEFAAYTPRDPRNNKNNLPPRYVAYLLAAQGEPKWIDLGEAAPIDRAIIFWRQALRDPHRADVKQLARIVDEKVMQPVLALERPGAGEIRRLLIAPDGALNLIPFAALVNREGRYLIERYSISYLLSGRDLLRSPVDRPGKQESVVVADPNYGERRTTVAARSRDVGLPPGLPQSAGSDFDLTQVYFPPLKGTAVEARALKSILPQSTVFIGEQATEAALKQLHGPNILHVATHGFFLGDQDLDLIGAAAAPSEAFSEHPVENPLLRSGLALAGVNLRQGRADQGDDGVLTALEAAGLDLWGTKLVVLSACDTGVGAVKNGEGVFGLRRALALAGSETQVMSLWPVSDFGTRDLMIEYYNALRRGEGRGDGLRHVQLEMLKRKGRRHPFYWASFIQSGEWANLEGKR